MKKTGWWNANQKVIVYSSYIADTLSKLQTVPLNEIYNFFPKIERLKTREKK
jgi:hypothetical protein